MYWGKRKMDEWAKNLWNNNKIVFFLAIPILLLVYFRSFVINLLLHDSRKLAADAEAKDKVLTQQATQANAQADQLVDDAQKLNQNKQEVTEDWNKK